VFTKGGKELPIEMVGFGTDCRTAPMIGDAGGGVVMTRGGLFGSA
jgi:hypothetical protein